MIRAYFPPPSPSRISSVQPGTCSLCLGRPANPSKSSATHGFNDESAVDSLFVSSVVVGNCEGTPVSSSRTRYTLNTSRKDGIAHTRYTFCLRGPAALFKRFHECLSFKTILSSQHTSIFLRTCLASKAPSTPSVGKTLEDVEGSTSYSSRSRGARSRVVEGRRPLEGTSP